MKTACMITILFITSPHNKDFTEKVRVEAKNIHQAVKMSYPHEVFWTQRGFNVTSKDYKGCE